MTPEALEAIFYKAYGEGQWTEPQKPLVQKELRMKCWQAVIDAVTADNDLALITKLASHINRDAESARKPRQNAPGAHQT